MVENFTLKELEIQEWLSFQTWSALNRLDEDWKKLALSLTGADLNRAEMVPLVVAVSKQFAQVAVYGRHTLSGLPFILARRKYPDIPEMSLAHGLVCMSLGYYHEGLELLESTIAVMPLNPGHKAALDGILQEWMGLATISNDHFVSQHEVKYRLVRFEVSDPDRRIKMAAEESSVALILLNSLSQVEMDSLETIVKGYWGALGKKVLLALRRVFRDGDSPQARILELKDPSEAVWPSGMVYLVFDQATISMVGRMSAAEWTSAISCLGWILAVTGDESEGTSDSRLTTTVFLPKNWSSAFLDKYRGMPWHPYYESHPTDCEAWYLREGVRLEKHWIADKCWTRMFSHGTVGIVATPSYTTINPTTGHWMGKGLRIPFDLMVHIAGVDQLVQVEGTPILTGFRTALIPMTLLPDGSVQWHFITATKGYVRFRWFHDRPEFGSLLPSPSERLTNVPFEDLKGTAYVGWSPSDIEIALGSQDPPLPIRKSNLPQKTKIHKLTGHDFQAGLQVTPIPIIGVLFSATRKYTITGLHCPYVPADNTSSMIDELFFKQVIIYDDDKKTAYLCLLIHLIVTLVRGYLQQNHYKYDPKILKFPTGVAESQAAIRKLQSRPVEAGNESYKYEDVFKTIVKRYSSINAVLPVSRPCTTSEIIGFELADILSGNAPFCPRSLNIANGWNALTQTTDVVFCWGLGEVIVHRQAASVEPCLKGPPDGCNILICPLRLLKTHFDMMYRKNCYKQRGSDDELVLKGTPFAKCKGVQCDLRHCWKERLQWITSSARFFTPKESPISTTISFDGDGALCLGKVSCLKSKSGGDKDTTLAIVNGTTSSRESVCDLDLSLDIIPPSCGTTGFQTVKTCVLGNKRSID